MAQPSSKLTRDLLAVREGAALDYASDGEAPDAAPSAAAAAAAAAVHDPYARSAPTFRGALHGLGLDPSGVKSSARSRLQLGGAAGGSSGSAGSHLSSLGGSLAFSSESVRLDAFARHKKMVEEWQRFYRKPVAAAAAAPYRTDADVLRENYRFVRTEADDAQMSSEQRQARRFYDLLHKEFALADLSRYKEGRVGLRWRTEAEVLAGTGHFSCGALKCPRTDGLASFELNFAYQEAGEQKQALVKLRVCPDHAYQLHYRKLKDMAHEDKEARRAFKQEEKKETKRERKEHKKKKSSSSSHKKRSRRERDARSSDNGSSSDDSSVSDDDVIVVKKAARRSAAEQHSSASRAAAAADDVAAADGALSPRGARQEST
jgi:protein FRA10AC1